MTDYTQTPPGTLVTRQVSIQSVDVVNHGATGITNAGGIIWLDTSYYVGAVAVTPTIGDQWVITKQYGQWKLDHRIPFNDPNQAVVPTQGQHVVGSGQGPVELQGTTINLNAPAALMAVATTERPDASTLAAGSTVFDTTLNMPIYSDGSMWRSAVGGVV